MAELLINNNDALKAYGVMMGANFIDTIEGEADQGEYITNKVRTEDGIRVIPIRPTKEERTITLEFQIVGVADGTKTAHEDYEAKVDAFRALCDNGFMTIQIPDSRSDVYRLYAQRKSGTYAKGKVNYGEVGKISVKFMEPNPTNRGAFSTEDSNKLTLPAYEDYVQQ